VLFRNAFVITSLCCPSRATLLPGLPTHLSGVSHNQADFDYERTTILPEYFKQAGYATAFVGKYHLGGRDYRRPGFDRWVCLLATREAQSYISEVDRGRWIPDPEATDALTDLAVEWIRAQAGGPFFLMFAPRTPHVPPDPPRRHAALYSDISIALPDSFSDPPGALPDFATRRLQTEPIETWKARYDDPTTALEEFIRHYARMIPGLDESFGRIDGALEDLGIRDRTVVLFTSDGGYLLGEHGLVRKGLPYEESMRVPLLIRAPGVAVPGGRPVEPVLNVDLPPTILDLAGIPVPDSFRGRTLRPLLAGAPVPWRSDWLYIGHYAEGKSPFLLAVRDRRWKYARFRTRGIEEQLFDLERDPRERTNLAGDPAHAERLAAMRQRMRDLMAEQQVPAHWFEAGADRP
jgi:N-acetylglucosamine-6-sulfatase